MSPISRNLEVWLARTGAQPVRRTISAEGPTSGILRATDGAPSADGAAHVAVLLAARRGTSPSTVSAIEPTRIVNGRYATCYVTAPEEDEALRSSLWPLLPSSCDGAERPQRSRDGRDTSHRRLRMQRASRGGCNCAQAGQTQFLERALGNAMALQLVQVANSPALAVPFTMTALPRRVLAGVDFSPSSVASAKACARWLT